MELRRGWQAKVQPDLSSCGTPVPTLRTALQHHRIKSWFLDFLLHPLCAGPSPTSLSPLPLHTSEGKKWLRQRG